MPKLALTPKLKHNLRLYNWIKVFSKRVYLPLTTIYLVEVGHLTLAQIGALATISAMSSLAGGIPTGYFADRTKRKTAIAIGAFTIAVATLLFVFFPSFPGAVVAITIESLGFAFVSGAGEALMHDALVEDGHPELYVQIMGRAQSFGLIGNIILVGLVPLTYGIDKRLPFIFGFIACLILGFLAISLDEPPRVKAAHLRGKVFAGLVFSLRTFINRYTFWIFLAIGMMSAFYTVYASFINLVFKDLGINVSYIGFIYAASSVIGAVGGWFVHHFKRVSLLAYSLFDVVMATSTMVLIGVTHNLLVAVFMGLLNMGFWRLRSIIYQDHLLRLFGDGGHKATLISAMGFFQNVDEIWLPFFFVAATTGLGYYVGFTVLGLAGFAVLGCLYIVGVQLLSRRLVLK